MPFAVQTSYSQTYQYGRYNSKPGYTDTAFDTEFMGKATSRTTSSSDGKNIGIMTIGSRGFIQELVIPLDYVRADWLPRAVQDTADFRKEQ